MKGWRERAADIFTNRGEIAAKMKSALGPGTTDCELGQRASCPLRTGTTGVPPVAKEAVMKVRRGGAAGIVAKHGEITAKLKSDLGPPRIVTLPYRFKKPYS